jgi:hypothetical protein
MRMLGIALVGVVLMAASAAGAKDADETLIEGCISYVHGIEPYGQFDAYKVSGSSTISMFGTKFGQFEFEKCMAQGGHTVTNTNGR